ncbi:MAG TPA: hypothetical protein VM076_22705 [Gemmatimonadaceae bacterium]|nr:hypothetical protein [Gemmatimonadaceae bacterium]
MRSIGFSLVATLLAIRPVGAQVRADPGVVIGNRVAVRVNATLTDEETPYYPVRGLAVSFARAGADTVVGRTDEAGVVTVLLVPGDYVVAAARPVVWKGVSYTWTMPIVVRADMPAIEFGRMNARRSGGVQVARGNPPVSISSPGDVSRPAEAGVSSGGAVRWLSMEVGGEGGLTRVGDGNGSDAGYGGSGSFVGGLGPVALALGYRYTRIRYGNDLDPGSMRGGTAELRYHLRPGAAPIRPYIGALAGVGRWNGSETLGDARSTMKMFGGTVGAQFGLATSVRLHLSATAAGTNIRTSSATSSNGLFATGNIGLTFDIFSPAR